MTRLRTVVLLGLLLLALPLSARDFKVNPGDVPELRPGEGLVLVAVDSDLAVTSLTVSSEDKAFTGGKLQDIAPGHTAGLYVMPAGKYRWDRLNLAWVRWSLRDEPEFAFEVKPGQISYAGDLVFRNSDSFHVANRGLRALDWLESQHPKLLDQHGFQYVGHYPDAFPDFYRKELQAAGSAPSAKRDAQRAPPAPGELPLPVEELWRPSRLHAVAMSDSGRRVASAIREGEGLWAIDLYDLDGGTVARLVESRTPVESLVWKDDQTLLANITVEFGPPRVWIFPMGADGKAAQPMMVPRAGALVDTLPGDPGHILFASAGLRETHVHRLDIRSAEAMEAYRFPLRERVNVGLALDFRWYTDARGKIRGAKVVRDESVVLVHGEGGKFAEVLVLDEAGGFDPIAVTGDGRAFIGLSEKGRQQRELVEFDPASKRITRTLFAKPGVDVVNAIFNRQGDPVGARYYESGQLVSEYFDAGQQQLAGKLARAFPGKTVASLGRSASGQQSLLLVDSSDQPALVYHLDLVAGRASVLEESAPWLKEKAFAPTKALTVRSSDGLAVEAFLTLPKRPGKLPLVVMPHGGPIGVADRRHFDPEVQFMASLGYAVLQVNFRGSEGYGKAFREAGFKELGTLIEDDIDAAIEAALAGFPIDPARMCAVGASYGGYSGLMMAVRSPERFRCVVSLSGVSDRGLAFTASDTGRSEEGRAALEKIIGDPRTQPERMRETSPLFRYRELTLPVMLVHGGQDIRVDYEHTRRLVRMLGLAGRPPVTLYFEGEGHGSDDPANLRKTWDGVAGFLRQHLDGASGAPAPAAAAE